MSFLDLLGGFGYVFMIGLLAGTIPALILGLLAQGRGYFFLKYFSFSLLLTAICVTLPVYFDGNILVIASSALASLGFQIWYLVKKLPRKVITYERKTQDL